MIDEIRSGVLSPGSAQVLLELRGSSGERPGLAVATRLDGVVIGGLAVNKIETWRFADAQAVGDTEDMVLNPSEKDPPTVYGFGHAALFRDFVDAIDQNREPLVFGARGKKALEIILAIYQSQKTGQPVDLPCSFSTEKMKGIFMS